MLLLVVVVLLLLVYAVASGPQGNCSRKESRTQGNKGPTADTHPQQAELNRWRD
jgi:hypothetical protein